MPNKEKKNFLLPKINRFFQFVILNYNLFIYLLKYFLENFHLNEILMSVEILFKTIKLLDFEISCTEIGINLQKSTKHVPYKVFFVIKQKFVLVSVKYVIPLLIVSLEKMRKIARILFVSNVCIPEKQSHFNMFVIIILIVKTRQMKCFVVCLYFVSLYNVIDEMNFKIFYLGFPTCAPNKMLIIHIIRNTLFLYKYS